MARESRVVESAAPTKYARPYDRASIAATRPGATSCVSVKAATMVPMTSVLPRMPP
jgi:hypothetical protein